MHIKAQTVIPAGTKITKVPSGAGKGKNIYTLLYAEEKKLERAAELKATAQKFAAALKVGYTAAEALKLIQGKE